MATAAMSGIELHQKRKSSFPFVLPSMSSVSELRVVLLGNSWSDRSSVANFILGETKFNTKKEPYSCQRESGRWKEKEIVLINSPDLLRYIISDYRLTEHLKDCVRLSAPGPHVFLLVLQPEDFTEEQRQRLSRVLTLFSGQSFDHSLILMSPPREKQQGFTENYKHHPLFGDMIRKCKYRFLEQKNLELEEVLTRLSQIVKENNEEHVSCEDFDVQDSGLTKTQKSEPMKAALNLVLCGRRGAGKTPAAEAILGQTELHSVSNSSECVKHQGEVCGRQVSLVELPALYGKPQEEVMEESLRCISLCDPEGVHGFILVLPVGPLTDEDKKELETIQKTFSCRVNDFTMILFTVESDPTAPDVVNFVRENRDIQELCQSCGGRSVVVNIKDKQKIPELLDTVDKMSAEGSRCFTKDVFTRAQMRMVSELRAELQDVRQKSQIRGEDERQSREPLRMVLIGRTGSGKGTTANTILGQKHFTPRIAPKPATESCEKATGEIDGRPVVVVNTPGLFDTTLSDDQINQELQKCISMLAPGPHVFLLVLQIGNFSSQEKDSVELIKKVFGQKSQDFTIIIFTRGEELEDQPFESYTEGCPAFVRQLIQDCGGRYQVFNNKDKTNHRQVPELLNKIQNMVEKNGGSCYTAEMFRLEKEGVQKQELQKIIKGKEQEMQEMKTKLEAQIRVLEQRAQQHIGQQQHNLEEEINKLKEELKNVKHGQCHIQ